MLLKGEKAMQINEADVAELVDARDLKSLDGNVVWVRVPPPAPAKSGISPIIRLMEVNRRAGEISEGPDRQRAMRLA